MHPSPRQNSADIPGDASPDYHIREAQPAEVDRLCGLLATLGLVTEGVLVPGTRYWLAESPAGDLLGLIGLELGRDSAVLLRSGAVAPDMQRRGIGAALTRTALDWCAASGYPHVYCFSTDAGEYWQRHGFVEVPVAELLARLPEAPQVLLFDRLGWLPTEVAWNRDLGG